MASTLNSDEERKRRVILVGSLFKETGLSTRKLARLITDNYFPISNCTVSDYMSRYCKLKPSEIDQIKEKIYENTPDSIAKEEVKDRVVKNVSLFENGFTISEIAESINTNFWTVYRDIAVRYQNIDKKHFDEVIKPKLLENSKENLKKSEYH